jgi:hypothetical protein
MLGLVFFGGGLIVSIIMSFIEPKLIRIWWIWIPVIIGYCIFTKMCLDAWKQRNNYVIVNDNSISLHSPENQIEIIKWNEVSEIKENSTLERLIIKDKYQKLVKLEYQLDKMSELLNIITKKIPHLAKHYSQLREFRRTKHLHLFFFIFLIFISSLTAYSWYSDSLFPTIVLGGFFCLIVYVLLIEYTGVRILDDGIVIIYPLWKREIKFSQIKNISFENIRGGNGKSSPFVILKLLNDKKFKLNALREGTIALFVALNTSSSAKPS